MLLHRVVVLVVLMFLVRVFAMDVAVGEVILLDWEGNLDGGVVLLGVFLCRVDVAVREVILVVSGTHVLLVGYFVVGRDELVDGLVFPASQTLHRILVLFTIHTLVPDSLVHDRFVHFLIK